MELLWFWIAVVLAISDVVHGILLWKIGTDFYILLGGLIHNTTNSPLQTWIIHELLEALFHFVVLSVVFLSLEIGILAAFIHFAIDVGHTLFLKDMGTVEHRALHFVIESIFFMAIFGI